MPDKRYPISLRLSEKTEAQLKEAAERTGIPKHTLCQDAIDALARAVNEHDGVVYKVEFSLVVKRVPQPFKYLNETEGGAAASDAGGQTGGTELLRKLKAGEDQDKQKRKGRRASRRDSNTP